MEAADDLGHLFPWVGGTEIVTVSDQAVLEEADMPGEEDALLGG